MVSLICWKSIFSSTVRLGLNSTLSFSLDFRIALVSLLLAMVIDGSLLFFVHLPVIVLLNLGLGETGSGFIFSGGDVEREACLLKLYASNCSLHVGDIVSKLSTWGTKFTKVTRFRLENSNQL